MASHCEQCVQGKWCPTVEAWEADRVDEDKQRSGHLRVAFVIVYFGLLGAVLVARHIGVL